MKILNRRFIRQDIRSILNRMVIKKEDKAVLLDPLHAVHVAIELTKCAKETDGRFKIFEPDTTFYTFQCGVLNKHSDYEASVFPVGAKACIYIEEREKSKETGSVIISKRYWLNEDQYHETYGSIFEAMCNASQDE